MISKKLKKEELVGKKLKLLDAIKNRAGFTIPAGSVCEIIGAHHNLTIRYNCICCGVKVEVSHIPRAAKYIELCE